MTKGTGHGFAVKEKRNRLLVFSRFSSSLSLKADYEPCRSWLLSDNNTRLKKIELQTLNTDLFGIPMKLLGRIKLGKI